jgi:hypothetical protein
MESSIRQSEILVDFKSAVGWNLGANWATPTVLDHQSNSNAGGSNSAWGRISIDRKFSSSDSRFIARSPLFIAHSIWDVSSESGEDDALHVSKLSASSSDMRSSVESPGSESSNLDICRHYLKGRCRHKKRCKFSHQVKSCPYCSAALSDDDSSKTAHLTKCWKSVQDASSA